MNKKMLFSLRTTQLVLVCWSLVVLASAAAERTAFAAGSADIRQFAGRTLTFAGYSSTFNEEWEKSFGQYFEKRTGVKVRWIPSSPSEDITRIIASGGKPDIDVMLMDSANLARGVQLGVVEKVDPAAIPNMSQVPESLRIEYGVPSMMYRYGNCYRKDKFSSLGLGVPNTTHAWFAKALNGHVMFPSTTAAQWLITAPAIVKSLGGEYDDTTKVLAALSKVRAYGFFNSSGDIDASMTAGDVWLAVGNVEGRCLALKRQGVPVEYANWHIKADGKQYSDLLNSDNLVMVRGTDNKELVEFFMNQYLSDEAISATLPLYQFIAGTPPTRAAVNRLIEMDPEAKAWIIQDPDKLFLPNYSEFLPYLPDWITGWSKILQ